MSFVVSGQLHLGGMEHREFSLRVELVSGGTQFEDIEPGQ
jgi:hypothetical protein